MEIFEKSVKRREKLEKAKKDKLTENEMIMEEAKEKRRMKEMEVKQRIER